MELIWFKVLAIVFIIIAGVSGGLLPLSKGFSKRGTAWLSLGNALAGGIFLGAGLLHMLPDAIDNFNKVYMSVDYPRAALLCGAGFLMVLFIEKVMVRERAMEALSEDQAKFPIVLFLVLAIHSIIAGATLGLEQGLLSSIVIFVAIIAHKGSASFALGVNLVKQEVNNKLIRQTIILFSIMTPLGILLGSLFSKLENAKSALLSEAVFDSLAAGTFIYIAVMDIINEVFEAKDNRWLHFIVMILGFVLMAVIAIWT